MKRSSPFRLLLWAVLLVAGFLAGTAWNTKVNRDAAPQDMTEENPYDTSEGAQATAINNKVGMPPGLTDTEKATIRLFENSAPSVAFITTSALRQDFWTRNVMEIPQGSGSGFVWDKQIGRAHV